MRISKVDYWLARLNYRCAKWMHRAGDFESHWLAERIDSINVQHPVFITGLARAGSTMLLELMSKHPELGSHRYNDFPFLATPWFWSLLRDRLSASSHQPSVPRPHQDGINITPISPESMEEPIWQSWFPWIHQRDKLHLISQQCYSASFEKSYRQHIAKVLLIRRKNRYLAKNNYHLTRLDYLFHVFPDAKLIVPIRNPWDHIVSLVRQHELFCQYAAKVSRVGGYMQAAGHYEFGPQRTEIRIDEASANRTTTYWQSDEQHAGYAEQWASLYGRLLEFRRLRPDLSQQILVTPYEDFCSHPAEQLARILEHCRLDGFQADLGHIKPLSHSAISGDQDLRRQVQQITQSVASQFGY